MKPAAVPPEMIDRINRLAENFEQSCQQRGLQLVSTDTPLFSGYRDGVASCLSSAWKDKNSRNDLVDDPLSYISTYAGFDNFHGFMVVEGNGNVIAGQWSATPLLEKCPELEVFTAQFRNESIALEPVISFSF